MKKLWFGLGLLLVACVAVYGVVNTVNASNNSQVINTLDTDTTQCTSGSTECPLMKSMTAVNEKNSECPYAAQLAEGGGCCGSGEGAMTALDSNNGECPHLEQAVSTGDGCCGAKKTSTQQTAKTQWIAEKE